MAHTQLCGPYTAIQPIHSYTAYAQQYSLYKTIQPIYTAIQPIHSYKPIHNYTTYTQLYSLYTTIHKNKACTQQHSLYTTIQPILTIQPIHMYNQRYMHNETNLACVNSLKNVCFKHKMNNSSQIRQFKG